jgi:hypothetical protein
MKSNSKRPLDSKSGSKSKSRRTRKSNDVTPMIDRDHSFSDLHEERHNRSLGIDHEPGVL